MTVIGTPTRWERLNVGSGAMPAQSQAFLWVDEKAWPVDVAANLRRLPFRDGSFEHVHCAHVIEHLPQEHALDALVELRRVLRDCGVLYVSAPDTTRAAEIGSPGWIHNAVQGGWTPGWEHRWAATVTGVRSLLVAAGFVPSWAAGGPPPGWPTNTHTWPADLETRFLCRKTTWPWPRAFPSGFVVVQ